jgi:hypothetical protein
MAQSDPITEFRTDPGFRRICWCVLFTLQVFIGLFYFIDQIAQGRLANDPSMKPSILVYVILLAYACAIVIPLRWKLRIDEQGLKRRWLFRWDSWTWNDIASGRVQKLHPHTLLDPDRPWWRRKLELGYMSHDHIQIVFKAINAYYRLPEAPEVPDLLKVKYGSRHSATFDGDGIHLHMTGTEKAYSWLDVLNVSIVRMDTLRRDFNSLQIVLPDEEIKLKHISITHPSWRGATSEVINEFLYRCVPTEKINVTIPIAGPETPNREQIERKLKELKKANRRMRIPIPACLILVIAVLAWRIGISPDFPDAMAFVMGGMMCFGMGSVVVAAHLEIRANIKKLKNQLNSLPNGDGHSGDKPAN